MNTTLASSRPIHVAIIMDGNGRWAAERGLPRTAGHEEGVNTVRRVVEAAPGLGIGTLSLFAFSADNWRRPRGEVRALLGLIQNYLRSETPRCVKEGVKVSVLGRREGLDPSLREAIQETEVATAGGRVLWLRIALNYSSRDAILAAAARLRPGRIRGRADFATLLSGSKEPASTDVDLLIRTGGEKRLSDFLLWECAYAELHFTEVRWPDFQVSDLMTALGDYHRRERRFGGLRHEGSVPSVPVPAAIPAASGDLWLR